MTQKLRNKVAIVTGASRGIGAAIAVRLAAEGAHVALVARSMEAGSSKLAGSLAETAERIRALGGECLCIVANLADPEQRAHIVPRVIERFGGVDILINNAAWSRYQPAHTQASKHVRLCFEVNLHAPLELVQQCVPSMRERGAGWIVNLSSATSNNPTPAPYDHDERYFKFNAQVGPSVYAASKAALERLSSGLATELAAVNIAVNTVAPVEAVASEGAVALGTIDAAAHMEPVEAMAEAVLELCSRAPAELSGRRVLSLDLLRELGSTVHTLDGREPLAGYVIPPAQGENLK
ncbi:MAG: SDR family NAD(P)-dependent oxidoreductase [Steroidobacteraceae bacterium]|jgi:NAD(P)-dependent dehydrogenase (short-subunit alcohol dehydrogenase family)|nr:SDR family NAD(P)-dependent oxidoreductase [Steroidobacteraceae bacterium]